MEELEDLENMNQTAQKMGTFICVVCKDDFEGPRVRGNPIRICKKCQSKLDKDKQSYCTTCRTAKDLDLFMPSNKHRCRKCHYETLGVNDVQTCLECGKDGSLVKYSKICNVCNAKHEANGTRFCVKCLKAVDKNNFPETGNVCKDCKKENVNLRATMRIYNNFKEFLKKANPNFDAKCVDDLMLQAMKGKTK